MHGGSVTAASEGPGRGSQFTVRLPLSGRRLSAVTSQRAVALVPVPLRVLIVDDNEDAADSLGVLLRYVGAETHVVHDGESALRALDDFRPDMVLLDIGMPGMDGYEVARRIRRRPEHRRVVLTALTGWGQEQDRRRSRAAGIDHHLLKPTDIVALQSLMSTVHARERRRS
jgi:CheY-like chemotaxis protein